MRYIDNYGYGVFDKDGKELKDAYMITFNLNSFIRDFSEFDEEDILDNLNAQFRNLGKSIIFDIYFNSKTRIFTFVSDGEIDMNLIRGAVVNTVQMLKYI